MMAEDDDDGHCNALCYSIAGDDDCVTNLQRAYRHQIKSTSHVI